MEKKTLGSFISVLTKAKGITQKELAEFLNVCHVKADWHRGVR